MKKKIIYIFIFGILILGLTGCGNKVKIVESDASKITYEDYNNGLVSLKIPKGWKVDVAPVDYISLFI